MVAIPLPPPTSDHEGISSKSKNSGPASLPRLYLDRGMIFFERNVQHGTDANQENGGCKGDKYDNDSAHGEVTDCKSSKPDVPVREYDYRERKTSLRRYF